MTIIDAMQFFLILGLFFCAIWVGVQTQHRQIKLESKWEEFMRKRRELYASMADPEKIEHDFERAALAREMRDAHRTTQPRDGAGPPAKVYRPQLRGKKPSTWRPNRVN